MFIIEKLAPDNMRIRLAGMKICEMMGMEVRGMQPGFLIDEADRLRFDRLLNVVMAEPAVVELKLAAPNRAGTYRATMLLMPLRSDFGDINRVIGCTSGEGDLFAPPLAFPSRTWRSRRSSRARAPSRRQLMPGFAEAQAAFAAGPAARRRSCARSTATPTPRKPREAGAKFRASTASSRRAAAFRVDRTASTQAAAVARVATPDAPVAPVGLAECPAAPAAR